MKSAYERALELLEERGIEPPRMDALNEEAKERIRDARSRAQAKLAELEILMRQKIEAASSSEERDEELRQFEREKRRIQDRCDREIATIHQKAGLDQ